MAKIVSFLFFFFLLFVPVAFAADQNFVTPVFPIRGREYWREGGDYKHFKGLKDVVLESSLPATWLIHYDILRDKEIVSQLKEFPQNQEIGLFLEVTRRLSEDSLVVFDWENDHWSSAHKLFLSGYSTGDRKKIIDKAFNSFKETFGYYPKSYGSWYTDLFSIKYIKDEYGASINLGLADQYSTDGYQTWGQYINQPYFVSNKSAIEPARDKADSTGVLKVLWAPREPTLSFGDNVEFSNFSLQVNDYNRSKKLDHTYFRQLLKDLTINSSGQTSQVVVGVEVAEVNETYWPEIKNQLNSIKTLGITASTLKDFNDFYRKKHDLVSPPAFINSSTDTAISYWYMSPNYRLGLFVENGQVILKDLRFYHQNLWIDNDKSQIDHRHNLSRLVPALIDQVVYQNQIVLGGSEDFQKESSKDQTVILFEGKSLVLSEEKPIFLNSPFPEQNVNQQDPKSYARCFDDTGGFMPPYPCLKSFLVRLSHSVPDIRYSKLHGQQYLGLAIDSENLYGIRFPGLKVGKHHFDFPVLQNFISLKKKLTPKFAWFGKQEFEIKDIEGSIVDKEDRYGQDNLRKYQAKDKLFENGYYLILKK